MAESTVFVSAARYEPFGLAVLEAAHAGCALVLSDIPTFRELWYDAAVFVSPDDPVEIAAALRRLLDDRARAAEFGAAAQVRAAHYTAEAMATGMLAIYAELLAQPSGRKRAEAAA